MARRGKKGSWLIGENQIKHGQKLSRINLERENSKHADKILGEEHGWGASDARRERR